MTKHKRPYDPQFKPKKVSKKVAALADAKGHSLIVVGGVTREKGRVETFPVQCRICAQVGQVVIKHNEGKIAFRDFCPIDDRCFTQEEFSRLLELGHEFEMPKDEEGNEVEGAVPVCKHCGKHRVLSGPQAECPSLEAMYEHVAATRDQPGTTVPGAMRQVQLAGATGAVSKEAVAKIMEEAGGTMIEDEVPEIEGEMVQCDEPNQNPPEYRG